MLGVSGLGWQDTIQSLESKNAQSKVLEGKLSKEITEYKRRILSRGIDDLPVIPNPRWGGFNVQPLLKWSVPSSEVTKCDTNTSPRRLATHLLQQVVQSLTSWPHSGHGSANATRNNTKAKDQTTIAKASKASSEYHAMKVLWGDPEATNTVWV
jgi:hypothetical protein